MSNLRSSSHDKSLAWQGWRIALPDRWDPAKIEGDAQEGLMLLADLQRPRLGIRWRTMGKKIDIAKTVKKTLADEVGALAASEAIAFAPPGDWQHGTLYVEPEPPGRDVWIGYSPTTRRVFQMVYHLRRRDRVLPERVLPTLIDGTDGAWSIFDLSCQPPEQAKLTRHRLNVGDLTLEFAVDKQPLIVRQISVASVAIARQPMQAWLVLHQKPRRKHYRAVGKIQEIEWTVAGEKMTGLKRTLSRRLRFVLMRSKPKILVGVALRDESRDKLLIVEGTTEQAIRDVLETMGEVT